MTERQIMTNFARPTPKRGEVYRHWKRGTYYTVKCVSRNHADGEELVTYTDDDFMFHTRTTIDFLCDVRNDDGKWVERFTLVSE